MTLLTEKYKPKNSKDIIHNNEAIFKLKNSIKKGENTLIYGPTGSGKTISVYAIANDLNYEVLELNASDLRNRDSIEQVLGNSLRQKPLFNTGKVILVDEIDGLSGNDDRGGVQAVNELLKESSYPLVLTCNNPWDSKLSTIRNNVEMIEFKKIDTKIISQLLKDIAKKEGIKINENMVYNIARASDGDIRAALTDLHAGAGLILTDDREKKDTIFNFMRMVFKSKDSKMLIGLSEKLDMDLDEIFLWIDENIPLEYKNEELYNAYEAMSMADVFRGRINRWQHWRFLVYVNDLLTAGVALSKKESRNGFVAYKRTSRILKLWKAKQINFTKNNICKKIAKKMHTSSVNVKKDFYFIQNILNEDVVNELNLDEKEKEWINEKV